MLFNPPLWFILLIYIPLIIITFETLWLFILGLGIWTLAEYFAHRWFFHELMYKHHRVHHINPRDNISIPLLVSLPVTILLLHWMESVSGFMVGYLFYELIHRFEPYWHLVHHKNPNIYFGVTSPIWDILFRTKIYEFRQKI